MWLWERRASGATIEPLWHSEAVLIAQHFYQLYLRELGEEPRDGSDNVLWKKWWLWRRQWEVRMSEQRNQRPAWQRNTITMQNACKIVWVLGRTDRKTRTFFFFYFSSPFYFNLVISLISSINQRISDVCFRCSHIRIIADLSANLIWLVYSTAGHLSA